MTGLSRDAETPQAMRLDDALAYALRLQQEGRVEGAAELYGRILEQVPEQVEALHFLGVAKFQLGDGDTAVRLIRQAIALQPDWVGAYNNLGNVLNHLGRLAEAAQAYRRVIELDPEHADAHNNLGVLLRREGRATEAERFLRRALELDPERADALHNLGNVLVALQRDAEAVDMYTRAIMLRPYDADNYLQLAMALYSLKREHDARKVYEKWAAVDPDNVEVRHLLAAATGQTVPERASDAYVQRIFDRFAERFDAVLETLAYRAPQIVVDRLGRVVGEARGHLEVLDAGCGTGLCGVLLKPWAHRLVGVDLSEKMLEKARLRGVYDHLVAGELTVYLSAQVAAYDVVVAADTLCYFGALRPVLVAAAVSLRPGGHLAFTVEKATASDLEEYRLQVHGRYCHTASYVRRALAEAGLQCRVLAEEVLRMERQEPVHGLVVVATKGQTSLLQERRATH